MEDNMKGIIRIIVPLAILVLAENGFSYQSEEKWKDISYGIDEIDLKTVAVNPQDPDVIYAGSTKSIFKSPDGGKTWQKLYMVRGTLTLVNVLSIDPRNPDIVYAGTQNGLYKTIDAGARWGKIFEGVGAPEKNINHLAIDFTDANRIYIGTNNGLFTSNDAGITWNKSSSEIANRIINFTAQDPNNTKIIYAAANTGIFKSNDCALSFERIFTASAQIEEIETDDISQNTNIDETTTYSNKTPNCIAIDTQDNNKIYIGTNSGVFISTDAGKSWDKLTSVGLINNKVMSLISTKDGTLYAATKNGIFKISVPYQKWNEIYSGLISKDVRYLAYNQPNNSILAATEKGIYQTYINPNPNPKNKPPLPDEDTAKILTKFESEPSVQEIQEVAIKYAEVHKKKIDEWRKSAKQKAMLPKVSVGIDESEGDYYYGGAWRGKDRDTGWDLSLTWDLSELIWNSDQTSIDTRSRLMVQLRDDILDEVTRLYFERRRIQIELLTNPPKNLHTKLEKELRLHELTAGIDALTGGWFSRRIGEIRL